MKKKFIYSLLGIIILSLVCACESGGGGEPDSHQVDAKEFVELKCSVCHFSKRIFTEPRHAEEWPTIVGRMRALNPQLISETDVDNITGYLQKNASK